jgi:hypothetical protein
VAEPYASLWREQKVFGLRANNHTLTHRSYSMASNPAADKNLVFDVRLATPPRGMDTYAGAGSSYLFSLGRGDRVTATGPIGSLHIKETDREMIYLGGGSGMAPLRSHLSYLFDTLQTLRRVSYWYGARSVKELFYGEYFRELARKYPNFTFQVALSEPQPGDPWTGHRGFIHEVLKREYLDSHGDPTQVEYYRDDHAGRLQRAAGADRLGRVLNRGQVHGNTTRNGRQQPAAAAGDLPIHLGYGGPAGPQPSLEFSRGSGLDSGRGFRRRAPLGSRCGRRFPGGSPDSTDRPTKTRPSVLWPGGRKIWGSAS